MKELFKPFPLAPLVSVGNMGTIIKPNGKPAKLSKHSLGYLQCSATIGGKVKVLKAHRVIALTWVDNPLNKPTVNHIDGIKTNIAAYNLEWATMKEQHDHAVRLGLKDNNHIAGKNKGNKHTEETKAIMSNLKKGKHRLGRSGLWVD